MVVLTILLIAFGTYGGGEGDYIHLKDRIERVTDLYYALNNDAMETHYFVLAYYLGGNYNLWRLVIFTIQFVGLGWFLYKAKLNTYPVYLCFVALCLVWSCYGRSFWGCVYFFMGLYLLIEKRNPLYLIAVVLCYFSHTQNIVLLALLPIGFIKIKSWHLFVLIALFGVFVSLLRETFFDMLNTGGMDSNEYLSGKMEMYGSGTNKNYFGASIGENMMFILRHGTNVCFVLYLISWIISEKWKYLKISKSYRSLVNVSVGLFFIAVIFLLSSISATLFYRTLGMLSLPIALLMPYVKKMGLLRGKTYNNFLTIFVITTELGYMKDLYYAYADGIY